MTPKTQSSKRLTIHCNFNRRLIIVFSNITFHNISIFFDKNHVRIFLILHIVTTDIFMGKKGKRLLTLCLEKQIFWSDMRIRLRVTPGCFNYVLYPRCSQKHCKNLILKFTFEHRKSNIWIFEKSTKTNQIPMFKNRMDCVRKISMSVKKKM